MKPTSEFIIKTVTDYLDMGAYHFGVKCRNGKNIKAIHLAMYFIYEYCGLTSTRPNGLSLAHVGMLFGRSHSLVVHARKSVINQFDTNKKYRKDFTELKYRITKDYSKRISGRFAMTINLRFYCFKKFHKFHASKAPFHVYFLKHKIKAPIEPVRIEQPVKAYADMLHSAYNREYHGYYEHQL